MNRRVVTVLAAAALVLGGLAAAPAGAEDPPRDGTRPTPGSDDRSQARSIAVPSKPTSGIADPGVRSAVRAMKQSRDLPHLRTDNGQLRVEVLGTGLRIAVRRQGGTVVAAMRGLVLADLPPSRVAGLERTAGVTQVRLPLDLLGPDWTATDRESTTPRKAGAKGLEALTKTGVTGLHARGLTGAGVRIGIIDAFDAAAWNAAAGAGELPVLPAGTFCLAAGAPCGLWDDNVTHGVAVAEVIKDVAPSADIYIASVRTATDFKAAIDYFAAQGVRVVNRSEAVAYDGPGDGSGEIDAVVSYAETQGITFVKSAGNTGIGPGSPGGYFRGLWTDVDNDQYMEFAPGDEALDYDCGFTYGLRWSDWGAAASDYDMYVYDGATLVGFSKDPQGSGQAPLEFAKQAADPTKRWYCTQGKTYQLYVYRYAPGSGSAGDVLEFMVKSTGGVQYASNAGSAAAPISDAANPGALAVGAVDPPMGTAIATYSSQGPTNDGRIKPDLSAPASFSSFTYGYFKGTSAAAPVVAGTAALLLGADPGLSAAALAGQLRAAVVDRGAAGPDNLFGTGELFFAPPPQPPQPPPPPPPPPVLSAPSTVRGLEVKGRPGAVRRTVQWRAPAATGGSPISAYRVKVKMGRSTLRVRVISAKRNRFVLRTARLPRGRLVVTVAAVNTVGAGPKARAAFVVG